LPSLSVILCASFAEGHTASTVSAAFHALTTPTITGGCIIISNSAVLGFLEGTPARVNDMIKGIGASECVASVRIVSMVCDSPSRTFNQFGTYSFNPPNEDGVDVQHEGGVNVGDGIAHQIAQVAFPDVDNSANIVGLPKSNTNSVPSATRCTACTKADCFPTVAEFLEIYAEPIGVVTESEKIFPLQSVVSWK